MWWSLLRFLAIRQASGHRGRRVDHPPPPEHRPRASAIPDPDHSHPHEDRLSDRSRRRRTPRLVWSFCPTPRWLHGRWRRANLLWEPSIAWSTPAQAGSALLVSLFIPNARLKTVRKRYRKVHLHRYGRRIVESGVGGRDRRMRRLSRCLLKSFRDSQLSSCHQVREGPGRAFKRTRTIPNHSSLLPTSPGGNPPRLAPRRVRDPDGAVTPKSGGAASAGAALELHRNATAPQPPTLRQDGPSGGREAGRDGGPAPCVPRFS